MLFHIISVILHFTQYGNLSLPLWIIFDKAYSSIQMRIIKSPQKTNVELNNINNAITKANRVVDILKRL
tara:strand:+ start:385 stop:591 length:207 start_codon:yes stop_codon:yes gene_type:complete